jgi:hypothetical protein
MTGSFAQRSRLASTLTTAGGTDYTASVDTSRSTIPSSPMSIGRTPQPPSPRRGPGKVDPGTTRAPTTHHDQPQKAP